jgi:hypothetical protein
MSECLFGVNIHVSRADEKHLYYYTVYLLCSRLKDYCYYLLHRSEHSQHRKEKTLHKIQMKEDVHRKILIELTHHIHIYKFISKRRIIYVKHSSILRWIWLNFMAQYKGFFRLFSSFHNFSDFQLFRPEYH